MNLAYLAVALAVLGIVAFLFFTTVPQPELPSDNEMDSLGADIESADLLLEDFDSLVDLELAEINESLFNP
jgi:hypothetical protein